MLSRTKYYVRTNYGDSDIFASMVGVVQPEGSVLATFLFAIYITPMSEALKRFSQKFEGQRIPPQLFADDSLLVSDSPAYRVRLIEACLSWAKKWKCHTKRRYKRSGSWWTPVY